jgi:hypothetical protein
MKEPMWLESPVMHTRRIRHAVSFIRDINSFIRDGAAETREGGRRQGGATGGDGARVCHGYAGTP